MYGTVTIRQQKSFILQSVVFIYSKYSDTLIFCAMSISSWITCSTIRGSLRDDKKFEIKFTILITINELI